MNKCKSCGMENNAAAQFCGTCGAKCEPDINAAVRQAAAKKTSGTNTRNIVGLVVLIIIVIIGWGVFKSFDNADIKKVKQTDIGLSGIGINITYGDLLDDYCKSKKWTKFTSSAYSNVVEFNGKTPNGESVLIQFSDNYGLNDGRYVVVYAEIGGKQFREFELANWFMNAAYSTGKY